jgi:RNA polymerase sigma factor (sigma-70 family)
VHNTRVPSQPVRWFELLQRLTDASNPAGQRNAFAELYALTARCLGPGAWRSLAPDERESLVGECVVRFVELYREQRLSEPTFPGLVKTHATRRYLDLLRRRKRGGRRGEELREDIPDPGAAGGAEERLDAEAERRALRQALGELDGKQHQVLELRYAEGLTRAEIAKRLGLGSGQVRTLEANGLIQLRILLSGK